MRLSKWSTLRNLHVGKRENGSLIYLRIHCCIRWRRGSHVRRLKRKPVKHLKTNVRRVVDKSISFNRVSISPNFAFWSRVLDIPLFFCHSRLFKNKVWTAVFKQARQFKAVGVFLGGRQVEKSFKTGSLPLWTKRVGLIYNEFFSENDFQVNHSTFQNSTVVIGL